MEMNSRDQSSWSPGSSWHRWDPHVHVPGTLLNDQFCDDWAGFLAELTSATPRASVLGITDYCSLRSYKKFLEQTRDCVIPELELVFPNVELRLTVETRRQQAVNIHLLVSPEDAQHVKRMDEQLAQLHFPYDGQTYPCTDDALIRLGRDFTKNQDLPEGAALREGAKQFKASLDDLRKLMKDRWFANNVLIAVAAGNDGLSGLSKDAGFAAQRQELARFAHVIFSGSPSERDYWLGNHAEFQHSGYLPKPCLHGCDCHSIGDVLRPAESRICWIRGEPVFDTLRQVLVEPARRVHIGDLKPTGPSPANIIRSISVTSSGWFPEDTLVLNDGFVAIIGARGSGKTALADLIAAAAGCTDEEPGPASFIRKAGTHLLGTRVVLDWEDDSQSEASLLPRPSEIEPRARYLSQQFVERLCAPERLGTPLIDEMERIVFNAIPDEDRLGTTSFDELRRISLARWQTIHAAAQDEIRRSTTTVADEHQLQSRLPETRKQLDEVVRQRESIEKQLRQLPTGIDGDAQKAFDVVAVQLRELQRAIAVEKQRLERLAQLESEYARQRDIAEAAFHDWHNRYSDLFNLEDWQELRPRGTEAVQALLDSRRSEIATRVSTLEEHGLGSAQLSGDTSGHNLGLEKLKAEHIRLSKVLGSDEARLKRRTELSRSLSELTSREGKLKSVLENMEQSPSRIERAQERRLAAYERLFESLDRQVTVLENLYRPLRDRLEVDERLRKLEFRVVRSADVTGWAAQGEEMIDRRKESPFKGIGNLALLANDQLNHVWEHGTPAEARDAMATFSNRYAQDAIKARVAGVQVSDFGDWLFSTEHISVQYSLQYEGIELERLSPGSRGVVLLTLYLGLDEWDDTPLIIDQPEENLDPQSIYDDLVSFFRTAATRRQIILVTHNANLVVNGDADQVIVAMSERMSTDGLPHFHYTAGGLENRHIRDAVCRLLEGGREAFERRRQRYQV